MSIEPTLIPVSSSKHTSKKESTYSEAIQKVSYLGSKVILGLCAAYAVGKVCQRSQWLRTSLTQSCFFYSLFHLLRKEPFLGFLAMSSSFFIAKNFGVEEESYQLCNRFLKTFQKALQNSELVGTGFASYAQCVDHGFTHLKENKGLPLIMGICTSTFLVHLFELQKEKLFRKKGFEVLAKVVTKVSCATFGSLVGGICAKSL